jgi:hypothetical protein
MTHIYLSLNIPRFAAIGCVVIHCGRDVERFATEHDAAHAAAMMCEIFKDVNSVDLYDALFPTIGG